MTKFNAAIIISYFAIWIDVQSNVKIFNYFETYVSKVVMTTAREKVVTSCKYIEPGELGI